MAKNGKGRISLAYAVAINLASMVDGGTVKKIAWSRGHRHYGPREDFSQAPLAARSPVVGPMVTQSSER